MKSIYFSGKAGDGKTATALGIALKLQDEGLKVSYFKPLGFQKGVAKKDDTDVRLMRDTLKLPFSSNVISPFTVHAHYLTGQYFRDEAKVAEKIEQAFQRCSEGYDVVLIDGSVAPYIGFHQGLDDFSLAERWQAAVIYILKPENDFELDRGLLYLDQLACRNVPVIGCIFNNISRTQWDKARSVYKSLVERKEIHILGFIPRQEEIAAPTVREFYDALQGEVLAASDKMNRIVEEVVIGTMTAESALSYLRKAPNKALITGGDRSNMALAALETSTSVIIFTGGFYPDVRVLSKAEEKGVPVILVREDTYTTIENLHSVYRSIHPQNTEAIKIVKRNIEKYVDWNAILEYVKG
ncbi:MAG: phosphotransacetylase family protein [Firmicutes bacterium]|jgi:BioD-like phosphotransacetylase family protein|nr:phosphotransacetylase family protein [Bacillota bacterium]